MQFKHCPIIEIGDIFTRIDKNGKTWKAEIINRTEYYVDVKKYMPYKAKVGDEYGYHYEDAPVTIERAMLYRVYEPVENGTEIITDFFGNKIERPKIERVPTARYHIQLKEDFTKHRKYDRDYYLIKYEKQTSSAEEGFQTFYNYIEEENK